MSSPEVRARSKPWEPGDLSPPNLREVRIRAAVHGQAEPETLARVVDELAAMTVRADEAYVRAEAKETEIGELREKIESLKESLAETQSELVEERKLDEKRAADLAAERAAWATRVEGLEVALAAAEERIRAFEAARTVEEKKTSDGELSGQASGQTIYLPAGRYTIEDCKRITLAATLHPEPSSPPVTFTHDSTPARPPFKMAGGKTRLLVDLLARIDGWRGAYHEPFAGGAALFWALEGQGRIRAASLSDANPVLVRTLRAIRDDVERVIELLSPLVYDRQVYERTRALGLGAADDAVLASRFLYLNRTCFNGLWRVNKAGEFNVPFGRYKNPTICDAENLRACSAALRRVDALVSHGPFEHVLRLAAPGDLVYLDPPYVPASRTANFASYTNEPFKDGDHVRLRDVALELKERGVRVILSNSDTPRVRELYAEGFTVEGVIAPRSISCKGGERRDVGEVIVT